MIQESVINSQSVTISVILQIVNLFFLLLFMFYYGNFVKKGGLGSNLIHFGPSNKYINIDILGFQINNWKKWLITILFLVIFEAVNTYSYKIYKNWYRNLVADPKSDRILISKPTAMIFITIWRVISWIFTLFKWILFIITKQIQFMLPMFLSRLCISNLIDLKYMESKNL